jgi:threonine synthase
LREKYGFPNLFLKMIPPIRPVPSKIAPRILLPLLPQTSDSEYCAGFDRNAGSSMAGVGAAANLNVTLFLPKSAPPAKMIQALQYGANLIRVDGNYDLAYDQSMAYSREKGGLSAIRPIIP